MPWASIPPLDEFIQRQKQRLENLRSSSDHLTIFSGILSPIFKHPLLAIIVALIALAATFSPKANAIAAWVCICMALLVAVVFVTSPPGLSRASKVIIGVLVTAAFYAFGHWLVLPLKTQSNGVEPPAIQRFTAKQLQDRVSEFVRAMRQDAADFDNQQFTLTSEQQSAMRAAEKEDGNNPRGPHSAKAWQEWNLRLQNANEQYGLHVSQEYVGVAIEYRDELLRRLGPQSPIDPKRHEIYIWDDYAGGYHLSANAVRATAQYLENLARKLS